MRYLTKEWYLAGQTWPVAADVQARLDETGRAFREARAREDLPPELMRNGTVRSMRAQEDTYSDALISDQESSRKKAVAQLMREYDGNKAKVARSLGIARSTLYRILKERE